MKYIFCSVAMRDIVRSRKFLFIVLLFLLLATALGFFLGGGLVNQGFIKIDSGNIGKAVSAFDWVNINKRWLIVYEKDNQLRSKFLSLLDGSVSNANFTASGTDPAISFGCYASSYASGCSYAVAYQDGGYITLSILRSDNAAVEHSYAGVTGVNPTLAFNEDLGQVFLAFEYNGGISGVIFDLSAQPLTPVAIAVDPAPKRNPSAAYGNGVYLVAWEDYRASNWDIYFQVISSSGTPVGGNTAASFVPDYQELKPNAVFYKGNKFLIFYINPLYCLGVQEPGSTQICYQEVNASTGQTHFPKFVTFYNPNMIFYVSKLTEDIALLYGINENGIDKAKVMVLREEVPVPIEITPRYVQPTSWYPSYYERCATDEVGKSAELWGVQYLYVAGTTYADISTGVVLVKYSNYLSAVTFDAFNISITTQYELPYAVSGAGYPFPSSGGFQLGAKGGSGTYRWYPVWGTMPEGLTLEISGKVTGVISDNALSPCNGEYPCPYTFSAFIHDFSSPVSKTACKKFEIKVWPFPATGVEVNPTPIVLCAKPKEAKVEELTITNKGTPVSVKITSPLFINYFGSCTSFQPPGFFFQVLRSPDYEGNNNLSCNDDKWEVWDAGNKDFKMSVSFQTLSEGVFTTSVSFSWHEPISQTTGIFSVPITGVSLYPDIGITSPAPVTPAGCQGYGNFLTCTVDFGEVAVWETTSVVIYLNNMKDQNIDLPGQLCIGDYPIRVTMILTPAGTDSPFRVTAPQPGDGGEIPAFLIPLGGSFPLWVRFSPWRITQGERTFINYIRVLSDDHDEGLFTVKLVGKGIAPVIEAETSVNCGVVLKNHTKQCIVKIKNAGRVNLIIKDVKVYNQASGESGAFSSPSPTNFTVAPGNTADITVAFGSSQEGLFLSLLNIYSNSISEIFSILLVGEVIDRNSVVGVIPPFLNFEDVVVGERATREVTLVNRSNFLSLNIYPANGGNFQPFQISPMTQFLEPGTWIGYPVYAEPPENGEFLRTLSFVASNPTEGIIFPIYVNAYVRGVSADISVDPSNINFGEVPIGGFRSVTVTISNPGTYNLVVTQIKVNPPFLYESVLPFVVLPQSSTGVKVYFAPTTVGIFSDILQLYSNVIYKNPITVQLIGRGRVPGEGEEVPGIVVVPSELDFGDVVVGGFKSMPLGISNTGDYTLLVTYIQVEKPFSPGATTPFLVSPQSSSKIDIYFTPNALGTFEKILYIYSNVWYRNPVTVVLRGRGISKETLAPYPKIQVEPQAVDFGKVRLGEKVEERISIRNIGVDPLYVASISLSSYEDLYVRLPSLPAIVNYFDQITVSVEFYPQREDVITSSMVIISNSVDTPMVVVQIRGEGANSHIYVDDEIDFGRVRVGKKVVKSLIMKNTGNLPLQIKGIEIVGEAFSLDIEKKEFELQEKSEIAVPIYFLPTRLEEYRGEITIYSSDLTRGIVKVGLSGIGGSPVLYIERTEIDFGQIYIDEVTEYILPISNIGSAPVEILVTPPSVPMFSVEATYIVIPAGASYSLRFVLSPQGKFGRFEDVVKFITDDPRQPEIQVKLSGTVNRFKVLPVGGGCSCSASSPEAMLSFLLQFVITFIVIKLRSNLFRIIVFAVVLKRILSPYLASADIGGVDIQAFKLSQDVRYFSVIRTAELRPKRFFSSVLFFNFSDTPLKLKVLKGTKTVDSRVMIPYVISGGISLGYVTLQDLELNLYFQLMKIANQKEFEFADPIVEARWKILDLEKKFFLAINPVVNIPVGGEFSSYGVVSPRVSILSTYKSLLMGGELMISGGLGMMYISPTQIGDVSMSSSGLISGGVSYSFSDFSLSFEALSSIPFENIRKENTPVESVVSIGYKILPLLYIRSGAGFGLTEGIGTPKFRVFSILTYNIGPDLEKRIRISGSVIDSDSNPVDSGYIYIPEIGIYSRVSAGKFEVNLPEGEWTFRAVSPGYLVKEEKFAITASTRKLEITLERGSSKAYISLFDRSGIPTSKKILVKSPNEARMLISERVVVSVPGIHIIQVDGREKEISFQPDEIVWVNLKVPFEEIEAIAKEINGEGGKPHGEDKKSESTTEDRKKSRDEAGKKEGKEAVKTKKEKEKEEEGDDYVVKLLEQVIKEREKSLVELREREVKRETEIEKRILPLIEAAASQFEVGRWEIPRDAFTLLDRAAEIIISNSDKIASIEIEGHADPTGDEDFNIILSYMRALEVRKYLLKKGVRTPIRIIGYGSAKARLEKDWSKSRRIEIKVFAREK